MIWLPGDDVLSVRLDFRPHASKNSREARISKRHGKRMVYTVKSRQAEAEAVAIVAATRQAMRAQGHRGFGRDRLGFRLVHDVLTDSVSFDISRLGPHDPTGTRSDLQNIAEGILDCLQGVAYDDDRQFGALISERERP